MKKAEGDGNAETAQIGAEAIENVIEVAVRGNLHAVDLTAALGRSVEERLDLLLRRIRELAALAAEELDDGFLTPDLAFDFPSAAADMINRASSAGATTLYSRCARRIDIDRPDRAR